MMLLIILGTREPWRGDMWGSDAKHPPWTAAYPQPIYTELVARSVVHAASAPIRLGFGVHPIIRSDI
jgi:hypothetical protein